MMTTRGQRLRSARKKRFKSANAAAAAMGIPVATYGSHERAESPGGRDFGPEEAKKYARRFGVTAEWLLVGSGEPPAAVTEAGFEPATVLSLISMLNVVMTTIEISVADLERIAATIAYAPVPSDPKKKPELREGGIVGSDPEIIGVLNQMVEHLRSVEPMGAELLKKLRQDYRRNLAAQIVVDN